MNTLIMGGALTATFLAGCTSEQTTPEPTIAASSPVLPATEQAPAPETPQYINEVAAYLHSPERGARIQNAANAFGQFILSQPANVGGFDTYCSLENEDGSLNRSGYTTEGYEPQAGDNCSTYHNPQYGGSDFQIGSRYIYGTEQFSGAYVNNNECIAASADYLPATGSWVTGYSLDSSYVNSPSTISAETVAEAQQIDDVVLNCVANAQQ